MISCVGGTRLLVGDSCHWVLRRAWEHGGVVRSATERGDEGGWRDGHGDIQSNAAAQPTAHLLLALWVQHEQRPRERAVGLKGGPPPEEAGQV
jgi:hypothetical protein